MRVTINGKVPANALRLCLDEQNEKCKAIEAFCKDNKIATLYYKDSELEFEYDKQSQKQKVETRNG